MKMRFFLLLGILAALAFAGSAVAQESTNADPWPRQMTFSSGKMTVYQPQVDSWDGGFIRFRAAIAVRASGDGQEVFGTALGSAHTLVDRTTRMVTLFNYSLLSVDFPSLPDHGERYFADVGRLLPPATTQISLDRLRGFLSVEKLSARTVPVKNDPPQIIISYRPSVMVPIAGYPILRNITGTSFDRVVNSRALILYTSERHIYLHVYDGWMTADDLKGPWRIAAYVPEGMTRLADELSRKDEIDLLAGDPKEKLSLSRVHPAIYIEHEPAELIVFDGQPRFEPIAGTVLLWATNSRSDVIVDADNNDYYLLISGRWFRGASLSGPWAYIAGNDLPTDFRRIPPRTAAGEVLASIAGTPQAKEALIADSIPQTALIPRSAGPAFTPVFDGSPQLRPIEGTSLRYVVNSPDAIIQVSETSYYALQRGVWFSAGSVLGPWVVTGFVPDIIYTIPASSPLHYVTYVQIYWASPESVMVGYTPGYVGTVVEPDGVVVYGTGYSYSAWVGTDYYPPPPTYGVAAYPAYDPAATAMFGFAMGMMTASLLAPAPYWGPVYYNNYYSNGWHGCCWSSGYENFYGHYGSTTYNGYHGYGYNPYTGNVGQASNFHTYNAATGMSSNVHSYSGYNAYTGTEAAGYNRQFYNQHTGTSGDVDRNAAYNPYNGNFERSGSASAYNPNSGAGGSIQHTSEGNIYGGSTGETTATVTNRAGQTNTYEAGHTGNDVYAGSDGNVYRSSGNGWQKNTGSGWANTGSSFDSSYLDHESQARSWGGGQYSSFANRGFFGGGGFGGGFNGGYRGGGFGGWHSGGGFGGGFGGGGGSRRFGGRW